MKKACKILLPTAVALIIVLLIISDIIKTDYPTEEKNAVAMGTVVSASIYGGDEGTAQGVIDSICETENLISKNIDSSFVSVLNKAEKVTLPEDILYLFKVCNDINSRSDGGFDITTGALSALWDIGGEGERIPSDKEIIRALEKVDGTAVRIDGSTVSINPGQYVDLGAAGKGFAADMARKVLESSNAKGAVISVGGSICLYGKHNAINEKWSVAVRDPFGDSSDFAGILELGEGFVSTSGDYERFFERDGKRYHHILSPFDGYPVSNSLKSVTVIANKGALSDILSTACFVMGLKDGMRLAHGLGVQAVFIDENKNIYITDGIKNSFRVCAEGYKVTEYEYE